VPDALLVTSSFLPGQGGIESYLAELSDELSPRLAVLAPAKRDGQAIPANLPYPTGGRRGSLLWPGRATTRAIVAAAAEHGTDRVLFGTPWPLLLTGPRLAREGLRYASIVHGAELTVPAAVPGVRSWLVRALRGADALYPVSEYTAGRIRALVGAAPTVELLRARVDVDRFHPGARDDSLRARLGIPEDAEVILCFGRLVARKGVDRLIRALPQIRKSAPRAVVVVAGTGPELGSLKRLASNVNAPVVFAGRVADADAPSLYATSAVFALPVADRWRGLEIEGLGVVLLEAAACGLPCVTGRSGGTPEAVLDGRTGFVIDGHDVDALATRVTWLLEHPGEARAFGAAGRDYVTREFAHRPLPASLRRWLG
jgi:phosphatidylinositol alpha-1,6-mannosyltransferase